jgi:hypothetical protein
MVDRHQVLAAGDCVLIGRRDRQAARGEVKLRGGRFQLCGAESDKAGADDYADQ